MSNNFKESKYNHIFELNGKNYIYNLLTTAIAEFDQDTLNKVKDNNFDDLDQDILNNLIDEGFLVEHNDNEVNKYAYYYDSTRFECNENLLKITILPTYGCNLACPYCYEGQGKDTKIISKGSMDSIIKFINSQIDDSASRTKIKYIVVSYFGGEPLLCKNEIKYMCENINSICTKFEVNVEYDITSNLTLLDDSFIDVIKKYNIEIQVTIDGTKEQHDKRRIYHNGKGTYDVIINNLNKMILAGLKNNIVIRINVDDDNSSEAEPMFIEAIKYSNHVYFGYLTSYKGYNDEFKNCLDTNCQVATAINKLNKIYRKYNFDIPLEFGKRGPCRLNAENTYIVDCLLDVYKCELLQNHKECSVGKIDEDGNFIPNSNFYQQMSFSPMRFNKCVECKLLPLCGSGCPAKRYINSDKKDGNIINSSCEENEKSLDEYLKDYVLFAKE